VSEIISAPDPSPKLALLAMDTRDGELADIDAFLTSPAAGRRSSWSLWRARPLS
jgi:hypothetical protein